MANPQPRHPTPDEANGPRVREHAVLQRVADGDESALATLYERWAGRVHDVAYWILQDQDEAEDVVEETFWQVWRTANGYDWRRASAWTWLAVIARSRALDRLRAGRRTIGQGARAARDAAGFPSAKLSDDPHVAQERAELHTVLVNALDVLPGEQRQVLELAFFEGLSHAEVAKKTDLPLGTVKTRIRLAMLKLRQQMALLRDGGL